MQINIKIIIENFDQKFWHMIKTQHNIFKWMILMLINCIFIKFLNMIIN